MDRGETLAAGFSLDAGRAGWVLLGNGRFVSELGEKVVEGVEFGLGEVSELCAVEAEERLIDGGQERSTGGGEGNVDFAAILQAPTALGEALGLEAIDEAGDIRDADDHHFADLVAQAAGFAVAAKNAEDVVGTWGEIVGLEEAFKGFRQLALCSGEVEEDLLLEDVERKAFSEFGLQG